MGQLKGTEPSPLARRFIVRVVGVGVLLTLPSLWAGFVADDYLFIARLEQSRSAPIWQLYEFITGEPGQRSMLMANRWAAFCWWTADALKVRFLRPLSSGLFALDHALFGQSPLGYHLHSLLWYALLLLAVGLLLRAICSPKTFRIALPLFAICAGHAESVAWLASRHMLVSTVPALFGLLALIRRREAGFGPGFGLGLLGMLVGLLGGEAALSVVCYWLAYEAFGAREAQVSVRVRRVAAPLALLIAYAALYKALGYGAADSGAYLDPISTPGAYFRALPQRLAILLADLLAGLPSGLASMAFPAPAAALGGALTLATFSVLRSLWPDVAAQDRRALCWLVPGALLALFVNAGAVLGARLALIPGIGAFVVIGSVLGAGWSRTPQLGARGLARRSLYVLFAVVHVLLAPLGLALNCHLLGKLGDTMSRIDASLDSDFAARRALAQRPPRVFVLAASDPFAGFYIGALRAMRAPGSSAQWTLLSMAKGQHHIVRTGPNVLTLRAEPGLLRSSFEGLFRSRSLPLAVGAELRVEHGIVRVLAVEAGLPTAIALTLTQGSFDDPDVCLLVWREQRLLPVRLALDEALDVAWSPGPTRVL